jgi:membrane associated rhomboid family serine protease
MIPLRDSQPSHSFPLVTVLLIAANVMLFLFEFSLDGYSRNHFVGEYGMTPARFELADLITSMFLHGGWMHLIGNMWFLWIYGDNIEDILGKAQYLVFYLLSGIAAGLTHYIFNTGSPIPTVGASGAIAGVMGAYMLRFPHAKIVTLVFVFVFITTYEIPAWFILIYWFVIQIFSGFGEMAGSSGAHEGGVAWFAHAGGFLMGMLLIKVMKTRERYQALPEHRW